MSEEILIRQGAPTLAGIKTGSLFPCPCEDREDLLADIRRLNRRLVLLSKMMFGLGKMR